MEVSTKYCRYCGRLLKSKASIERGFGLTCYKKYLESIRGGGLLGRIRNKEGDQHIYQQTVPSEILHDQKTELG